MAVEPLEAVQDGPPDRLRQPQASRQVRADLAVRPRPLGLQPPDARRAAQCLQSRSVNTQARQELQRLTRLGRIDQVTASADHDVIPAEHRGDLMRRRGAAGEPHQRSVIDLDLTTYIQPRPPGQLRRQQARAHRLTRRVPASQVTHHRQRRDHARHADPLPHKRKSKDQLMVWVAVRSRCPGRSQSASQEVLELVAAARWVIQRAAAIVAGQSRRLAVTGG